MKVEYEGRPLISTNRQERPKLIGEVLKEKELSVNEKLDVLMEAAGTGKMKTKDKTLKIPLSARWQKKAFLRFNKVLVIWLKTNRTIEVKTAKIESGMIHVGNNFHAVDPLHIYLYKEYPTVVLPEWSLEAFGTKDYIDAIKDNKLIHPQKIIIRMIEMAEVMSKKKIGGKTWIWIVIAIIVVGYIFFGGGLTGGAK